MRSLVFPVVLALFAFAGVNALPSGACMQRPSSLVSARSHSPVFATHHTRIQSLKRTQSPLTASAQTCWFPQTLDHFNRQDQRTYYQRYYINDAFYEAGSPIFVYIGGEGELSINDVVYGEIVELAEQHNALLLGLEHRFYGSSHPFPSLTPQNLRYLSSQQALADLASFVKNMSAIFNTGDVITVGGSYPGALSAFFRIKFPYLTRGVLASSAPVFAEAAFIQYDQTVAASLGSSCANLIRNGTSQIEARLTQSPSSAQAVKNYFGCGGLEDPVSFLYALADAVAFSVQYDSQSPGKHNGMIGQLCNTMANSSYPTLVDAYQAAFTRILGMLGETCLQFSTSEYSMNYTTVDPSMNARQWYYQSCTEFGFFQVAAPDQSLRSTRITLQWHLDLCTKLFGPTVLGVNFTNTYYGGKSPVATNIYFVNGNIDPWHTLSITTPLSCCSSVLTTLVNGTAHCADLYPSSNSDPAALQQARSQIAAAIASWLPAVPGPDNSGGNGKKRLIIGVVVGCFVGLTAIVAFAWYRRRKQAQERDTYATNTSAEVDYSQMS